jgi:bifunctional UDP-N-acetylglucosamine pyrophosphorylase/glucosamine-1-phosphate N-acetyltransferase
LLSDTTLLKLTAAHEQSGATLTLTTGQVESFEGDFAAFYNFGRIVRNSDGSVLRIVELKDASDEEKKITEVNLGYYCFQSEWLWQNIDKLQDLNKAKEYYLTDLVGLAREQGQKIQANIVDDIVEGFGINTPEQLAIAEKYIKK